MRNCGNQSVVLTTIHQSRERRQTVSAPENGAELGWAVAGLGWDAAILIEWCRQTPFSSVWLVTPPHRQTPIMRQSQGAGTEKRLLSVQLSSFRSSFFKLPDQVSSLLPLSRLLISLEGASPQLVGAQKHTKSRSLSMQPLTQPRLTQPRLTQPT